MNTLQVPSRQAWREWLLKHHESEAEIWLVFSKVKASQPSLTYDDAVEEALCFGWVDSLIKRLNERDYARKFTPRKQGSKWSTPNRQRYAKLQAAGLLAPAGVRRSPTTRNGDAPRASSSRLPTYIERALKKNRLAWKFFEQLAFVPAPLYRLDRGGEDGADQTEASSRSD